MPSPQELAGELDQVLLDYPGVPRDVVERMVNIESGGRADAVSPKGAMGIMQLMPATAREMGVEDPADWRQNLRGGVKYLAQNIDRFGGDVQKGVAAYHAGPGAVTRAGGIPDTNDGIMSTRNYVAAIAGDGKTRGLANPAASRQDADFWAQYAPPVVGPRPEAPAKAPSIWRDMTGVLWKGVHGVAEDLREGVRLALGDDVVDAVESLGEHLAMPSLEEVQATTDAGISPEMHEALGKQWVTEDEEGNLRPGPALTDWRSLAGGLMQSIPGTVVTMVPAFRVGRLAEKIVAGRAAAAGLSGEAAKEAGAKALATFGAAAGAVLEGAQGGVQGSREVRETIAQMPEHTLQQSQVFRGLLAQNGGDVAAARAQLADDQATQAFLLAGVGTGIFGGVGDKALFKLMRGRVAGGLLRRAGVGAAAEAFEEAGQGAASQMGQNIALQQADPSLPTTQGVANQVVGGGVIGGVMGGGMGAAFGRRARPATEPAIAGETVESPAQEPPAAPAGAPPAPQRGVAPEASEEGAPRPAGQAPGEPTGDIRRADGSPFASRHAAAVAAKRMDLKGPHAIVRVGPEAFVLRPAGQIPNPAAVAPAVRGSATPEDEAQAIAQWAKDLRQREDAAVAAQRAAPRVPGMQDGDVGRSSDGTPFLNREAAKKAVARLGLGETHDVVRLGKDQYVVRPQPAQREGASAPAAPSREVGSQDAARPGEGTDAEEAAVGGLPAFGAVERGLARGRPQVPPPPATTLPVATKTEIARPLDSEPIEGEHLSAPSRSVSGDDQASILIHDNEWKSVRQAMEWLTDDRGHGDDFMARAARELYDERGGDDYGNTRDVYQYVRDVLARADTEILDEDAVEGDFTASDDDAAGLPAPRSPTIRPATVLTAGGEMFRSEDALRQHMRELGLKEADYDVKVDVAGLWLAHRRANVSQRDYGDGIERDEKRDEVALKTPRIFEGTATREREDGRVLRQRLMGMTIAELDAAVMAAREHNDKVDVAAVREVFGDEVAKAFEAKNAIGRRKWWEQNATERLDDIVDQRSQDADTISEYREAAGDFDTESPELLGRSIVQAMKKADAPDFANSPAALTIRNAIAYAQERGWDLDQVTRGARQRARELYGADAPELIARLFRAESASGAAGIKALPAPTTASADEKARWIKAVADRDALMPGGSMITGVVNGRLQFNGDPRLTKAGRGLLATYEDAVKAGATPEEIAAAIKDRARSTLPDAVTKPSFADEVKARRAAREALNKDVADRFAANDIVRATQPNGITIALTRGMGGPKDAPFRVTSFEGDTPTGHRDYGAIEDAAQEFIWAKIMDEPARHRATKGAGDQAAASGVDAAAHEAASSPRNDLPEPSKAQILAALGHVKVGGLDISIENPAGSIRKDLKNDPPKWQNKMKSHYGYVKRTEGADGDHVDVFVKPGTPEDYDGPVFVVNQVNASGKFDEVKAMIGFPDEKGARKGYLENYAKGWKGGRSIRATTMAGFKEWLASGDTKKAFPAQAVPRAAAKTPSRPARTLRHTERVRLEAMREHIGWAEYGGRLIRAAPESAADRHDMLLHGLGAGQGEVVGRTKWIRKSDLWPERPDKALTEKAAHEAIDAALAGRPLKPMHQRFVDHVLAWSAPFSDDVLEDAGYNDLSPEAQAAVTAVIEEDAWANERALEGMADDEVVDWLNEWAAAADARAEEAARPAAGRTQEGAQGDREADEGAPARPAPGEVAAQTPSEEGVSTSETYEAVKARADAVSREYRQATEDYRARRIGDAEFVAVRSRHEAAQAEFDQAFAAEQERAEERALIERHDLPSDTAFVHGKGLAKDTWAAVGGGLVSNYTHKTKAGAALELRQFLDAAAEGARQNQRYKEVATQVAATLRRGEQPTDAEWAVLVPGFRAGHRYARQPAISPFLVEYLGVPKHAIRANLGDAAGTLTSDAGAKYPIVYLHRLATVFGASRPELGLTGQTEEEIRAEEESQRAAARDAAAAEAQAEAKESADRDRDSFALTGSDRVADTAAVHGQGGLFEQRAEAPPADRPAATAPQFAVGDAVQDKASGGGGVVARLLRTGEVMVRWDRGGAESAWPASQLAPVAAPPQSQDAAPPPRTSLDRRIEELSRTARANGWRFGESMNGERIAGADQIVLLREAPATPLSTVFTRLMAKRAGTGMYSIEVASGVRGAKRGVNALNVEGDLTEIHNARLLTWDGKRSWASNEVFAVLRDYMAANPAQSEQPAQERERDEATADREAIAKARADSFAQAEAIPPALPDPATEIPSSGPTASVADFGEKIGGARKDTARPLGPRKIKRAVDERPAWARKYIAMEQMQRGAPLAQAKPTGKWELMRLAQGKRGAVSRVSRTLYDSEEAALASIPLAEVSRNHRVYTYTDKAGNPRHGIFRQIGERKRALVKGGFETNEAAMQELATNPVPIIEHKFDFPEKPWLDRIERIGEPRREGNVTTKMFQDTFGFRGGEFGNWNMGSDGQAALNHAYDALVDLADTIGVPPKALSLNGELAIAFGARGTGGENSARAHYEPDAVVINLTKIKGAGSLAHEWFHALDDYLARSTDTESDARARKLFGHHRMATHRLTGTVRPELKAAFEAVVAAMTTKKEGIAIEEEGAKRRLNRAQENVQARLDNERRYIATARTWGNKKAAATAEQLKEWDALAQRALAGDNGAPVDVPPPKGARRGSFGYRSSEVVRGLNAIYKAVTGRSFDTADSSSAGRQLFWAINSVADMNKRVAAAQEGTIEERRSGTEFFNEAKKIDGYRASDYWSTPDEMGARAFESYIFDKMSGAAKRSDYLVHSVDNRMYALLDMKPYPEGDERVAINRAFDNLFQAIQAKETDRGIALNEPAAQYNGAPTQGLAYETATDIAAAEGYRRETLPADRGGVRVAEPAPAEPGQPGAYPPTAPVVAWQKVGTLQSPVARVNGPDDAARIFQDLRKYPREKFTILLTDDRGKVLGVSHIFAGSVAATAVYPREVALLAYATPGATRIWFAHNHPSGTTQPSAADENLTRELSSLFGDALGIKVMGHVIIGGDRAQLLDANGYQDGGPFTPSTTPGRSYKLPVIERIVVRPPSEIGAAATSTSAARDMVQRELGYQPGVVWLNSQNQFLAASAMSVDEMAQLRAPGRFRALMSTMGAINPAAALVRVWRQGDMGAVRNLGTALALSEVRLLDAFYPGDAGGYLLSAAESGEPLTRRNSGGSARFDALDKGAPAPVWRSMLSEALPKAPWSKAGDIDAAQLGRWLEARGKDGTFKPDELAWSGLTDWLAALNGKVKRDDVQAFLDENGVRVEETQLGAPEEPTEDGLAKRKAIFDEYQPRIDALHTKLDSLVGKPVDIEMEQERIMAEGQALMRERNDKADAAYRLPADRARPTKFSSYQLPGGENYRELLLTLPTRKLDTSEWSVLPLRPASPVTGKPEFQVVDASGSVVQVVRTAATAEGALEIARRAADRGQTLAAGDFRSSHFDQPNILAHVRFNERTDAEGRRVLFIEELQSDWAQKGRKEGFRGALSSDDEAALKTFYKKAADLAMTDEDRAEYQRLIAKKHAVEKSPPSAPFVGKTEAWVALALKRVLRYAVDNGFDAVAWTTGEQQAARYDLSKRLEFVEATRTNEGIHILARTPTGAKVTDRLYQPGELPDIVGKELADKIMADVGPGQRAYEKTYSGLDLQVGGEGMRAFYDRIVPNVANDILKKIGGGRVDNTAAFAGTASKDELTASVYGAGETYRNLPSEGKRKIDAMYSDRMGSQPGFTITPQMRASAQRGLPLFALDPHDRIDRAITPGQSIAARASNAAAIRRIEGLIANGMEDEAHRELMRLMRVQRVSTAVPMRERIEDAAAAGEMDPDSAALAVWLLERAPHLANDASLRLVPSHERAIAGNYDPVSRLITLVGGRKANGQFRGDAMTAAHEFMHHAERMMPAEVQQGVREEWARQLLRFRALSESVGSIDGVRFVGEVLRTSAGDMEAAQRVRQMLLDAEVNADDVYQLTNPSEFWAENASRILNDRKFAADHGWVAKARQWLRELVEEIKRILGLTSDAPVIRALDAILAGDGIRQSDAMLHDDPKNTAIEKAREGVFNALDKQSIDKANEAIRATLSAQVVTDVPHRFANSMRDLRRIGVQALGRRQIVDIYQGDLPALRHYNELAQEMDAEKNEASADADNLVREWAKLPDERELADLMHDATLVGTDPDRERILSKSVKDWAALKARFDKLSPGAKAIYRRARDMYAAHYDSVREATREKLKRVLPDSPKRDEMLRMVDEVMFRPLSGVYFPLARFGDYVIVARKDGKRESVSFAETLNEAEQVRKAMLDRFPPEKGFTVDKIIKRPEYNAARDAVGRGFVKELFDVLDKANSGDDLKDAINQLYLTSLPDVSWAKHGIHRKGTPGFSQDARRAFAGNVFHGARYLAKLRYADRLEEGLDLMQAQVDQHHKDADYDSVAAQQIVDEMRKRHDLVMNPTTNQLSTNLTSLGFIFHLGLSPASAMVNLAQTPMVAYPLMAAKYGWGRAARALMAASRQVAGNRNDLQGKLSGDEERAYEQAVKAGVIDVTLSHDLAGIAGGEDSKAHWRLRPVMRAASLLFHHAERFNRQATFLAAYRLARATGRDHAKAYAAAVQDTYDGHFDYGSSNRPRFMQGNVARVILLFKQFGQNMIYTMARNAYKAAHGDKQAQQAILGLLATHAAAAGVLGLPAVTTLLAIASALGGSDDEPWDAQVALRNMLADAFGAKPAEVLVHGLSRLTPWDVSGRLGLDRLIFPDVREGIEGADWVKELLVGAAGPVAAIGISGAKGMAQIARGDWQRGLEDMAPAALRGPLRAVRFAMEGSRDRTGIQLVDDLSALEIGGQVLGLSPGRAREAAEGKGAIYQADRALRERRQALMTQYAHARAAGDTEGQQEALAAIRAFNQTHPTRKITASNLANSMRQRDKRKREAEHGLYLPKKHRDLGDLGRFAASE